MRAASLCTILRRRLHSLLSHTRRADTWPSSQKNGIGCKYARPTIRRCHLMPPRLASQRIPRIEDGAPAAIFFTRFISPSGRLFLAHFFIIAFRVISFNYRRKTALNGHTAYIGNTRLMPRHFMQPCRSFDLRLFPPLTRISTMLKTK